MTTHAAARSWRRRRRYGRDFSCFFYLTTPLATGKAIHHRFGRHGFDHDGALWTTNDELLRLLRHLFSRTVGYLMPSCSK